MESKSDLKGRGTKIKSLPQKLPFKVLKYMSNAEKNRKKQKLSFKVLKNIRQMQKNRKIENRNNQKKR